MTKQTRALQMAINALTNCSGFEEAIQACKEALAEQPTNMVTVPLDKLEDMQRRLKQLEIQNALYADDELQKEWQGMSDDEIISLEYDHVSYETFDEGEYGTDINIYTKDFARAIEAKLREKNT